MPRKRCRVIKISDFAEQVNVTDMWLTFVEGSTIPGSLPLITFSREWNDQHTMQQRVKAVSHSLPSNYLHHIYPKVFINESNEINCKKIIDIT